MEKSYFDPKGWVEYKFERKHPCGTCKILYCKHAPDIEQNYRYFKKDDATGTYFKRIEK